MYMEIKEDVQEKNGWWHVHIVVATASVLLLEQEIN